MPRGGARPSHRTKWSAARSDEICTHSCGSPRQLPDRSLELAPQVPIVISPRGSRSLAHYVFLRLLETAEYGHPTP